MAWPTQRSSFPLGRLPTGLSPETQATGCSRAALHSKRIAASSPKRLSGLRRGAGEWTCVRIALEGVLILGDGLPEGTGLADLVTTLPGQWPEASTSGIVVLGNLALLVGRIEDFRAGAGADEISAKVGPVDREEPLEQVPIREPLRIEDDLDRLGVTLGSPRSGYLPRRRSIPRGWR